MDILAFFVENRTMIYALTLAIFLGFELIAKVPTVLHTPLMSGANAISGVVIIGAILLVRQAEACRGVGAWIIRCRPRALWWRGLP